MSPARKTTIRLSVFLLVGLTGTALISRSHDARPAATHETAATPDFATFSAPPTSTASGPTPTREGDAHRAVPPAFASFDTWRESYLRAAPRERAALLAEGRTLAAERRAAMKELIQIDPAVALSLALPASARAGLPPEITDLLETLVNAQGRLMTRVSCALDHEADPAAAASPHAHEVRHQVEIDGRDYDAFVSSPQERSMELSSIEGVSVDEVIAVSPAEEDSAPSAQTTSSSTSRPLSATPLATEDSETTVLSAAPAPAVYPAFDPANPPTSTLPPTEPYQAWTGRNRNQLGPKTVMFMNLRPSDSAAPTVRSQASMDAELDQASRWFYNASYRQTWFGPKVLNAGAGNEMIVPRLAITPVLNLNVTKADLFGNLTAMENAGSAAVRALGGEYNGGRLDPDNFDRLVFFANDKLIGSTGLAYVPGRESWVGPSLNGGTTVHEWNHNWGVMHSYFWKAAGSAGRGAEGENGRGNPYSGMGGETGRTVDVFHMADLGFITEAAGEVKVATSGGIHRLYNLWDVNSKNPVSALRGLVVPIARTTRSDWLNPHLSFVHDASAVDGGSGYYDYARNAVVMVFRPARSTDSSSTGVIDSTPGSRDDNDTLDAAVKIGQTYSEGPNVNGTQLYGGFHVTPLARGQSQYNGNTHEWIDVAIYYNNAIGANNRPPAATLAQASYAVAVNTTLELRVNASDPDGNDLAYDWRFGDGNYNIVSSPVQTRSWSAPGLYRVSCTVSDLRGGKTDVHAWVNVGGVSPRAPDSPAAVVGGLNYRYYEGAWNALPDFDRIRPVAEGTVNDVSIAPRLRDDEFGFVYEGFITVPATDVYTFTLRADDGVRLRIGDQVVVLNDGLKDGPQRSSGNISLTAGRHRLRLDYFHRSGAEALSLSWSTLQPSPAAVPAAALSQVDPAANAAPGVAITSPAEGVEILVGSDVNLQADAADSDGIARVQFFAGQSFLGEATAPPYAILWPRVSVGPKSVVAIATDTTGRRRESAPRTFTVVSPPPANTIGINFAANGVLSTTLQWNDAAGAVYAAPNWNNVSGKDGVTLTTEGLVDQTGARTAARAVTTFQTYIQNNAPTTDANGRLMRTGARANDGTSRYMVVDRIPYAQYDVYVYFDNPEPSAGSTTPLTEFRLNGQSRFGRNSTVGVSGQGDYPSYSTWVGFKESTATSSNAPVSDQLGNYTVYRNQTAASFRLEITQTRLNLNGLQIVERPGTVAAVRLDPPLAGPGATEGAAAAAYSLRLVTAPTGPVTVTLTPDAQLTVSPASFTFTPADWSAPRSVAVRAVDDTVIEGAHNGRISFGVSGAAPYAGLVVADASVPVTDNDRAVVNVRARGVLREGDTTATASLLFTREGVSSLSVPLTVGFTLAADSTPSTAIPADYALSGSGVVFDSATATGTMVIPAGQAEAAVTVTAVDDTLPEYAEQLIPALTARSDYAIGSVAVGAIRIEDNDAADYFTEYFNAYYDDLPSRPWDLNNTTLTLTPKQGGGYRARTTPATAFPGGTTGFTAFPKDKVDGGYVYRGWWKYTPPKPVVFFGVNRANLYVGTDGSITFASGEESVSYVNALFSTSPLQPRLALISVNLSQDVAGTVEYRRITTSGEERTVIFYNKVRLAGTSINLSAQVEFFDNGTIRMTWRDCADVGGNGFVVGIASGVAATMPSSPYTRAATPRPFYMSDLSAYTDGSSSTAPSFATLPTTRARAGVAYSYDAAAIDGDSGSVLTLSAPTKPAWLTLTSNGAGRATLSGTPPAAGTYPVVLRVSDGGTTVDQSFSLVVEPAGGNTPPSFTGSPALEAAIGRPYSGALAATDPDGQTLGFSLLSGPGWLALNDAGDGTATLVGTPPPDALVGSQSFTIGVSDGIDTTAATYQLIVRRPPEITLLRPAEGRVRLPSLDLDLHLEAEVDGFGVTPSPTLVWSQVSGPASATFTKPNTADTLVRFPQAGRYTLELRATNSVGETRRRVEVFAASPSADVLGSGLQAYIDFDAPATPDLSGNNRAVTQKDATFTADGYSGSALLGGSAAGNHVQVAIAQLSRFTAAIWCYPEFSPASRNREVWSAVTASGSGTARARLYLPTGSRRLVYASGLATAGLWRVEQDLPAQSWTHVVVSHDQTGAANDPVVYFDGRSVPVTRVTAPSGSLQTSTQWRIGATFNLSSNDTWAGRLDEFRLYDRIVPAADIALLRTPGDVNLAPALDLGSPVRVSDRAQPAVLNALVTDTSPVEVAWSAEGGAAAGQFATTDSAATSFTLGASVDRAVLRLVADDGEARVSATTEVTLEQSGGATDWRLAYPELVGAAGEPDADFDGDGVANLIEHALGTDPVSAGDHALPVVGVQPDGRLTLTFTRARADLTYVVEGSSDLVTWSPVATNPGTVGQSVTVADTTTASRRFLRLRVSIAP
jgi:hypothetical protein